MTSHQVAKSNLNPYFPILNKYLFYYKMKKFLFKNSNV